MVEVDRVYESKFKFAGVFDFKEAYNFVYKWLNDYGYNIIQEKNYVEKIVPEGKGVEITWEAKKKVSDYFRFFLRLNWMVTGMTNVEVEKNGIKVKINKGMIEIKVMGFLEKDYEHRWEVSPFSKFMRGIYDRYIVRSRVESYEYKIIEEIDELVAQAKSYLEVEGVKGR
ncbi:MAG: hypothetical protein V1660_01330 [archaeon]